jgi:hypothetical protein
MYGMAKAIRFTNEFSKLRLKVLFSVTTPAGAPWNFLTMEQLATHH